MAKRKGQRMGGKFQSSHTTVVLGAAVIADIADTCSVVTKISLGYIKAGLPPAKGLKRLKIVTDEGSLLLIVRDNISQQELRVYATDVVAAKSYIATGAHNVGFKIVG